MYSLVYLVRAIMALYCAQCGVVKCGFMPTGTKCNKIDNMLGGDRLSGMLFDVH